MQYSASWKQYDYVVHNTVRSVQFYYKHLAIVGDSCWVQTEQSVCWLAGLTACSKHRISHVLHGVRIMKGVETSTLATYTLKKATAHGQNFVGKTHLLSNRQFINSW